MCALCLRENEHGAYPQIIGVMEFCGTKIAAGLVLNGWVIACREAPPLGEGDSQAGYLPDLRLGRTKVQWARAVVQHEGNYLGVGLSNLIILFAPEQIALDGGVMRRWPLFQPYTMQIVQRNCGLVPVERVQISLAQLRDETPGLMHHPVR